MPLDCGHDRSPAPRRPPRRRGAPLPRPAPTLRRAGRAGARAAARRGADAVDDPLARRLPGLLRLRRPARGWSTSTAMEYVDLCLGDTGAMTGHALPQVAEAVARQAARGHHHDAALRRTRSWVGEELARRFGLPGLAAGDVGHRRQPVRAPLRPAPHRPAADRGDGLVLPRHRRRDAGRARRRPGRAAARCARTAGRRGRHDRRRAVQRSRRPRPPAGRGGRRVPADGAGADQHRHRAARGRLPRGRPRDHPSARRPAGHRRDAHPVRRPRRVHACLGARARLRRGRQADRRRSARQRRTA